VDKLLRLQQYLEAHPERVSGVVDFDQSSDKLYPFDFTAANKEFSPELLEDTAQFSNWISKKLTENDCRYGIGGYNENRTIYSRSEHFDTGAEPRRLHLGTDIWGDAGTKISSPLLARVHSFGFNNNFGDYGATIILQHDLDGLTLHTLYGHLSLASLSGLTEGKEILQGEAFAEFGREEENGHWPPHLHFQLIIDMNGYKGDYPGVCRFSERESWLRNSPNPELLLRYTF
jgi:murein DD-endopeptidase MepM/ murein hydrolase activator NlpD